MPIFEYLCNDCGRPFEKIVPRYDSQVVCVHCSSGNIEKQLSVFAVAGSSASEGVEAASEGCGRCGASQPGMCGMMD
jgi:putative FmdB family regulatory protein